jgi:uncharacterized membrane protein HdeD (DUF308 family)
MATSPADLARAEGSGLGLIRLRWWMLVLRGVFGIIFGILCFVTPVAALLSLILLFGIYSFAEGVAGVAAAWGRARDGERWIWLAVSAVASIVLGVLAFVWPVKTGFVLTIFIAAHALVTGIAFLVSGIRFDGEHGRIWLILAGILGIVFAVLIFLNPFAGALAITWVIGGWAFAFGVALILLGFKLRSARERIAARVASIRDAIAPE